jgi:benzoyl-CoA reductase/2-hydroxyglutaryl-CoA dehydratase subunit BcrC/BadD/HgdB
MNPRKQLATLKNNGRPVIACFPLYPPLALFHSMGLTPVVIWGLRGHVAGTEASDRHLPSYTCSVARHMTEFILSDARDSHRRDLYV